MFRKKIREIALKTGFDKEFFRKKFIRIITHNIDSEYLVIGMQRSGHHAIINWLRAMIDDSVLFNNCYPNGSPYNIDGEILASNVIRNFENFFPQHTVGMKYEKSILIIRDPWNQFCSYRRRCLQDMKAGKKKTHAPPFLSTKDIPKLKKIWISHAKEALNETRFLNNMTVILFDKWFDNLKYRKNIASNLNLTFNDSGKDSISKYGGGSTFDKLKFENDPGRMKVKERHLLCRDDHLYNELISDAELQEYANRIGFKKKLLD